MPTSRAKPKTTVKRSYDIQDLLDNGVQPFKNLDDVMLKSIAENMDVSTELTVPVILTSDGILIDGHQRLRLMLKLGYSAISGHDVRIEQRADEDTAFRWAVEYNAKRRHVSLEDKAAVAEQMRLEEGMSNADIARRFGVSRAAVTQWCHTRKTSTAATPAAIPAAAPAAAPATPHPWSQDGHRYDLLVGVTTHLADPDFRAQIEGLELNELGTLDLRLQELQHAVTEALKAIFRVRPTKRAATKRAPKKAAVATKQPAAKRGPRQLDAQSQADLLGAITRLP
jgi:hypothetical protein